VCQHLSSILCQTIRKTEVDPTDVEKLTPAAAQGVKNIGQDGKLLNLNLYLNHAVVPLGVLCTISKTEELVLVAAPTHKSKPLFVWGAK
jgi:hypothetical protein